MRICEAQGMKGSGIIANSPPPLAGRLTQPVILAGMHLQHLVDDSHSRHPGEVVVLLILALGLFAGSVWACQRDRNAG